MTSDRTISAPSTGGSQHFRLWVCVLSSVATMLVASVSFGESSSETSHSIFERYSRFLVQVRLLHSGSGATTSFGSGFFAAPDGRIATNYHVVAAFIEEPGIYRIEVRTADGATQAASLLAIDVINDLAILQISNFESDQIEIADENLQNGQRLYSLGNPFDLGMGIVEGTYNGVEGHSFGDRIHFTGSINPGMSGGPALLPSGEVAGINVATAGNAIGFLIPANHLKRLVEDVLAPEFTPSEDFSSSIRDQLAQFQTRFTEEIRNAPAATVTLGPFEVPAELSSTFKCQGGSEQEIRYETLSHACWTNDQIYMRDGTSSRPIVFNHQLVRSDVLDARPFYALYSQLFTNNFSKRNGGAEYYNENVCESGVVTSNDIVFKTVFCARSKKSIATLYDVTFNAAVLGNDNVGLETRLDLSSISFENAVELSQRFLEGIRWSK
jgi:serine protease Do